MRRTFVRAAAYAALVLPAASAFAQGGDSGEQPCRLTTEGLPAAFARCRVLEVPEDPAAPDGPSVELFIARIAALSTSPSPDPLLIITGGPGQSTVDFYLQLRGAFEQARRDRDLILVDQRGTGRSAAGFTCDVPQDLALETAGAEVLDRFVDSCLDALEHDPRFYTTSVAVRDLDRVRAAYGIAQWNVYGVSYGTRVAQHYARRFPERVRAVILDGVVPADVALGPEVAVFAQRALDAIFARCSQAPECAATFEDLDEQFTELLARLEQQPLQAGRADAEGDGDLFGASHLQALARFMSYNTQTAALLPLLFSEAYAGNYQPLVAQADTILRGLPEALSFPMSNAVVCTEDAPFMPETVEGLADTYLGTAIVDALRRICSRWPRGAIDDDFKQLLRTDLPVLLLSGDADPITPPAYAERVVTGGVTNGVHLIGRGQGHGLAAVGCVPRLMRAFLQVPAPSDLDAQCLALEPATPFFLSLMGPAP
jgi:pimeloyl-ACP methyl ester carboxylesterase